MKRTPAEMIAEFHRLYTIFETIEDCLHNQDGTYWTTGFGRLILSRQTQLDRVAAGEFPPGEIVAGTLQAINDTSGQLARLLTEDPPTAEKALHDYRARTGHSYWDDAKPPKGLIRVILKRGRIIDEAEARLLAARLQDQTTPLPADEAAKARAILAAVSGTAP